MAPDGVADNDRGVATPACVGFIGAALKAMRRTRTPPTAQPPPIHSVTPDNANLSSCRPSLILTFIILMPLKYSATCHNDKCDVGRFSRF